jgi:hypothetical protein
MTIDHQRLQDIIEEGSAERAWEHLEWMSREIPERRSGWPASERQADYLTDALQGYSLTTDSSA